MIRSTNVNSRVLQVFLFALLMGCKSHIAQGQEPTKTASASTKVLNESAAKTLDMTLEQFDSWVVSKGKKANSQEDNVLGIEDAVMERLRKGKSVTDESVIMAINAWISYESTQLIEANKNQPSQAKYFFPTSKRFINQLIPFLYGRSNLQAKIHEKKAYLFRTEGDTLNEQKEYEEALEILIPLHLDIDKRRVEDSLLLAGTANSLGDKEKAEALYSQVLNYPFWKVADASAFQYLKSLYVRAGKELINLRKGNLKALQQTDFIPSTKDDLGPALEEAIRQAGGVNSSEAKVSSLPESVSKVINQIIEVNPSDRNLTVTSDKQMPEKPK